MLQNGQKILKLNQHAQMGLLIGFLDENSSFVANIRNLRTHHVGPQFHVVIDDPYQTLFSSGENNMVVDTNCNQLFKIN